MAKAAVTQVMLIRSGRTAWDDEGRLQGRADLPATESGLAARAAELREWVEHNDTLPAAVYAPADEGAIATAETAAAAFEARRHKPLDGLASIHMGLWEGLTAEDLEDRHPKNFKSWREHPATVNVPEGEPVVEFEERVLNALLKLVEKHPKNAFALVLRPLEFAIVDRLLGDRPLRGLGAADLHEGPGLSEHGVSSDRLRSLLEEVRAGV
jgi:broad specificity phosphatase PhoE